MSLDRFNDFFGKVGDFALLYTRRNSHNHFQTEFLDSCRSSDVWNIDGSERTSSDSGTEIKFNPSSHTWSKNGDRSDLHSPVEHRFVLQIEKELAFQHGVINLILGPTASGKTSVLMALLGRCYMVRDTIYLLTYSSGEMYSWSSNGNLAVPPYKLPRTKGIAYAAQETWVLNDTIKVSQNC